MIGQLTVVREQLKLCHEGLKDFYFSLLKYFSRENVWLEEQNKISVSCCSLRHGMKCKQIHGRLCSSQDLAMHLNF